MSDLPSRDASLVELLDRLLDKGVVLSGDITISVADVDLIYLGLRVLLSSVETAERSGAPVPTGAALAASPAKRDALGADPAQRDALGATPSGGASSPALQRDALDADAHSKRIRDHATQPDAGGIDEQHAGDQAAVDRLTRRDRTAGPPPDQPPS